MGLFHRAVISDSGFASPAPRTAFARTLLATLPAGVVVIGTFAFPATGLALGLGHISGETYIGETLQLEVPLTGTTERGIDNECVSVRRPPDSIDNDYFPRDLAVRVDRQSASPRLVLTTQMAVRQPLVEFRIAITCGYNLSHDYLLMAAPRGEQAAAPVATGAPQAARPAAVPPTVPAPVSAPLAVAPAADSAGQLPDRIGGRNIAIDREMSLEALARQHFPGPLRQQRFMRWVAEANPQYFAGTKDLRHHLLPAGAQLVIPAGVPPRRPGDHQGPLNPIGEPNTDIAANSARPIAKAESAATGGRSRATSDGSKDRLVVGGGSAKSMKETIALVDQLTGMMEKQMNAQTAYAEKVKELETTIGDLDRQIKGLQTEAKERDARWQAERQAEKAAREQEAERQWWQLLLAVVAGGAIGGAILWALRAFRPHESAPEYALDEVAPEPQASNPAAQSKPLTEFGWDDEPHAAVAGSGKSAPRPTAPVVVERKLAPNPIEFELPVMATSDLAVHEPTDPATAAIELANIMTSMGLAQSAAETLVEHIRENPRESLPQWLKLLEIHRLNDNRTEFERSANELRQHFNVQPDDWNAGSHGRTSLESYPHIRSQVVKLWRQPDCVNLLRALLLDNREGTRVGFPLAVAEEILLLIAILNSSK
jgi:pilus assembly protein FimV